MNDLISRRAAIKAIDDLPNCYNGYSDTYDKACIIGVLEELPSVDVPDRKVGEWMPYEFGDYHWHKCSVCGKADKYIDTIGESVRNYCPNCGAKMDEVEE